MAEYRLDDLARISGVSARNIRAYRERGLLDPPLRVGRSAYYDDSHVAQLTAITQLLRKGFNSAHIAEFFNSLRQGQDLAEILGVRRSALSRPEHRLAIDPADEDARALLRLGLAEVVDDALVLTDPALGEMVANAQDQRLYVRIIVRVAESTGPAVDGLASLAVEALAECMAARPEPDCRELAQAVVAGSLDRALHQRTGPTE